MITWATPKKVKSPEEIIAFVGNNCVYNLSVDLAGCQREMALSLKNWRWLRKLNDTDTVRAVVLQHDIFSPRDIKDVSRIRSNYPGPIYAVRCSGVTDPLMSKGYCDVVIDNKDQLTNAIHTMLSLENEALSKMSISTSVEDAWRAIRAVMHRNHITAVEALRVLAGARNAANSKALYVLKERCLLVA